MGHSTGLLLVGFVLIFLSLNSDAETVEVPDGLSEFFESLVGFFMIGLGIYGLQKAWKKRPTAYGILVHEHEIVNVGSAQDDRDVEASSGLEPTHSHTGALHSLSLSNESALQVSDDAESSRETQPSLLSAQGDDSQDNIYCSLMQNVSTRTMAFCAGIIHGLAGPGGVLGVIPAVQLHNWRLATVYLGSFCACSTLTMGIFAATYGTCSTRLGQGTQREFQIEIVSASLSILVGITWLTLLSIGKLDDVFP